MSEDAADPFRNAPPGVGTAKMKATAAALRNRRPISASLVAAIALGPLAVALLVISADAAWPLLVDVSDTATAALYADFEAVRQSPGWTTETIRVLLGAAVAAVPPSLGVAAFDKSAVGKAAAAAIFYPAWLCTMLAPAFIVHQFAERLDPTLMGGHASAHFLVLFSAAATSIGLAFSLWARTRTTFYDRRIRSAEFA